MEQHINVLDHRFRLYMSSDEIANTVRRLASQLSVDYAEKHPLLCPVLTGSYMFAADLSRMMTIEHDIRFVRYSSYAGFNSTGTVRELLPFDERCSGRHVIIVEDIVDTGTSMQAMLERLSQLQPLSVAVCSFFFKPDAFEGHFKIDYVGRSIPNDFIVGYGLDYNEAGRHYNEIYVLDDSHSSK